MSAVEEAARALETAQMAVADTAALYVDGDATRAHEPEGETTMSEKLIDAIQLVAECAREASDDAEPIEHHGERGFFVCADDMHQIRAALGGWTRAGDEFIAQISAQTMIVHCRHCSYPIAPEGVTLENDTPMDPTSLGRCADSACIA